MKQPVGRVNTYRAVFGCLLLAELFHLGFTHATTGTKRQQAVPLPYVARWNCQGYGQLTLRTSDQLSNGRQIGNVTSTRLKKVFNGYWEGGTGRWFTPTEITPQSPWLYHSRTGNPNAQLYLGLTEWPSGDDVASHRPIRCTVQH